MNPMLDQALTLRDSSPQAGAIPGATGLPGRYPTRHATRTVFSLLEKVTGGLLEVRLPDGTHTLFGHGAHGGQGDHVVSLQVHDEALFERVLSRGDIGLAEAYLDGQWDSPDLTALLVLLPARLLRLSQWRRRADSSSRHEP